MTDTVTPGKRDPEVTRAQHLAYLNEWKANLEEQERCLAESFRQYNICLREFKLLWKD